MSNKMTTSTDFYNMENTSTEWLSTQHYMIQSKGRQNLTLGGSIFDKTESAAPHWNQKSTTAKN